MTASGHSGPFPPALHHGLSHTLRCTQRALSDQLDALQDSFSTTRCPCHLRNRHPKPALEDKMLFWNSVSRMGKNARSIHPPCLPLSPSVPEHRLWQNQDDFSLWGHRLWQPSSNTVVHLLPLLLSPVFEQKWTRENAWPDRETFRKDKQPGTHLPTFSGSSGSVCSCSTGNFHGSCTSSFGPWPWEWAFKPRWTGALQRSFQPCGLSQSLQWQMSEEGI